jgi:hypothetical protein
LNTIFSITTKDKRVQTIRHTTFRHTTALAAFALLSSFSGVALSSSAHNAVHKCLLADGKYEFTDKKCAATTSASILGKTPLETNSQNSEVKHPDASSTHTPLEAQPKHDALPNGSAIPSAPLKNGNPTT